MYSGTRSESATFGYEREEIRIDGCFGVCRRVVPSTREGRVVRSRVELWVPVRSRLVRPDRTTGAIGCRDLAADSVPKGTAGLGHARV